MGVFQQYGSHAFLPYVDKPAFENSPSSGTGTPSSAVPSTASSLMLKSTSSWTYCGPLLPSDNLALPPSLHSWASITVLDSSELLRRLIPVIVFLRRLLPEAGIRHYWLTIRATKPTHEYDTPRWHVDDEFFNPDFGRLMRDDQTEVSCGKNKEGWKLATTLLGPPTLFLKDNDSALVMMRSTKAQRRKTHQHECTSIRCLGCSTYADSVRSSLATSLEGHAIASPESGELAFFRLGDEEGAVHSEPKCDVDRIFINVVPGTTEELGGLMKRWGMQFPRAWCLGVPGGLVPSDECESFVKRASDGW
jgi:hypothetical protein